MLGMKEHSSFRLIPSDVIGKSLSYLRNTITLNIGEEDGVKANMPIISEAGLVGKVVITSGRYSIGQVVRNKDFRVTAIVERSRVYGIIVWEGGDGVKLTNVPKKQDVSVGDVVLTSDYSIIFPRDVQIGTVVDVLENQGSLFKDITISPSVDFSTLEQVFVVETAPDSERILLEQKYGVQSW